MMENVYMPIKARILEIYAHTEIEYNFRLEYHGACKPGQFFEVSIPKYGEAPISICGIGDGYVDLTIRKVGVVTDALFKSGQNDFLFIRGPYGNGFDLGEFEGKELIVVAGGSGLAPVKGILDHFSQHRNSCTCCSLLVGFKSPRDILFKDSIQIWQKNLNVLVTVDTAPETFTGKLGLVTKYVPELEILDKNSVQVVIVGPPIMMKFTILEFLKRGIPEQNIWVSYERRMSCGVGKCGHCKMDDTYICLDGPVFKFNEAKHLID